MQAEFETTGQIVGRGEMTPVSLELTYAVRFAGRGHQCTTHPTPPPHVAKRRAALAWQAARREAPTRSDFLASRPRPGTLADEPSLAISYIHPSFPNPAETLVCETARRRRTVHPSSCTRQSPFHRSSSSLQPYHRLLSRHGTARLPPSPQHPMSYATR